MKGHTYFLSFHIGCGSILIISGAIHQLYTCLSADIVWKILDTFLQLPKNWINILKILPPKSENFQIKNSDIFRISAQNIDCGYL